MREFERAARLARLPLTARLIYSVFLVFTLAALGVSMWLASEMVGLDLSGLDEYYAGIAPASAAGPDAAGPASSGPVLVLPDELSSPQPQPKSLRATIEVTHFHLFTMPLLWMVLAHLFALSAWSQRWKVVVVSLSAVAVATHLLAPWVARTASSLSTPFYAASGVALALSLALMSAVPLAEMWRRAPRLLQATQVDFGATGSAVPGAVGVSVAPCC